MANSLLNWVANGRSPELALAHDVDIFLKLSGSKLKCSSILPDCAQHDGFVVA